MTEKNTPKFKVGDRVIVYKDPLYEYRRGFTGTVRDISIVPGIKFDNGEIGAENQRNLEFEEIYNSPLWKAMNE